MKVSGTIEPGRIRETRYIDHKRVSLPFAHRISHKQSVRIRVHLIQMDRPLGVRELKDHIDLGPALDDLKWVRHVHSARHARLEALDFRVAVDPVFEVFFLSSSRPRLVRNLLALHNAETSRYPAERAEGHHRSRENHRTRSQA